MIKPILLVTLLSFGTIAQQITNPNTGAWAGEEGQQVFSPFPSQGRPQWKPTPDGKADTQIVFDYLEPAILACAAQISGNQNSIFKLIESNNEIVGKVDALSADIAALKTTQRTTGSGGGAVAVPGLDKVMAITGNAPLGDATVRSLTTVSSLSIGGSADFFDDVSVAGELEANHLTSSSGILARGLVRQVTTPEDDADAATKGYVDTAVANVGTNSIVLYTITPSAGTGFILTPVLVSGVTTAVATGSPTITFSEQTIVENVRSESASGPLTQYRRTGLIATQSTLGPAETIIEFVDHGSFGN